MHKDWKMPTISGNAMQGYGWTWLLIQQLYPQLFRQCLNFWLLKMNTLDLVCHEVMCNLFLRLRRTTESPLPPKPYYFYQIATK